MTYLTDIVQQVAIDLGITERFNATGGSTTTTANSAFGSETDPPDEEKFKGHYIIVRRDAAGAGAAPQGEWGLISAYNATTYTLTHAAVTAAVASGDEILFVKNANFPLFEIVDAVNKGLKDLGTFTYQDVSLTTVANQTEYALPSGVMELLDVQVEGNDDANDNQWTPIHGWRLDPQGSAFSAEPQIYIPQQDADLTIGLVYNGVHPTLTAFNSVVDRMIKLPLAVAATKVALLESFINSKAGKAPPHWNSMYSEALRQVQQWKLELPTPKRKKSAKRLMWSATSNSSPTNYFEDNY